MARAAILTALLALAAFEAPAQMYKCVVDGKTVYQQEKCPTGSKETTIRAPEPISPAAASGSSAAAPSAAQGKAVDEDQAKANAAAGYSLVVDVTAGYNLCAEHDPSFAGKYGNAFNEWGAKNREAYAAYNANPAGPADVKRRMDSSRAKMSGDDLESRAKREAVCARMRALLQ